MDERLVRSRPRGRTAGRPARRRGVVAALIARAVVGGAAGTMITKSRDIS